MFHLRRTARCSHIFGYGKPTFAGQFVLEVVTKMAAMPCVIFSLSHLRPQAFLFALCFLAFVDGAAVPCSAIRFRWILTLML